MGEEGFYGQDRPGVTTYGAACLSAAETATQWAGYGLTSGARSGPKEIEPLPVPAAAVSWHPPAPACAAHS